jgi:hypothetical protein
MPPPTICLLDGESPLARHALHLLAHRDVQVVVGHSELADAERVRHMGPCAHTHACPDPHDPTADFEEGLLEWLRDERPDVVVPLGLASTLALSRHRVTLAEWGVEAPVPPQTPLTLISDRRALWSEVRRLGLPLPHVVIPHAGDDVATLMHQFTRPPAVVPRLLTRPESAVCAPTLEEALGAHGALERRTGAVPLLMERTPVGGGWLAVTVLSDIPGGVMAQLCEVWSGWSAESQHPQWREISDRRRAVDIAVSLLSALQWTGPATVQFVHDERDGTPKILQVWPALNANLALGAAGGLDLLWPLVEWALGHAPSAPEHYRTGLHAAWEPEGVPWIFSPLIEGPHGRPEPSGERVELGE